MTTAIAEVMFDEVDLKTAGTCKVRLNSAHAMQWLQHNVNNRRVRWSHVEYLKRQILDGQWRGDHPHPLIFTEHGELDDGQHRLYAIAEAKLVDATVLVRVETGVKKGLRAYIDNGIQRTLDDRVELFADKAINRIAAQIVACWWNCNGRQSRGKPTPLDAESFVSEHKAAIEWLATIVKKEKGTGQVAIRLAAIEYYEKDAVKAEEFYRDLFVPAGAIQQAQLLRDYLLRTKRGGGGSAVADMYRRAISCMKAHMEGRELRIVRPSAGWE